MMLFQIEEPDGTPLEAEGPGAAVGIDLSGPRGVVAIAVGGNAETLAARDGEPDPETAGLRDGAGRFLAAPAREALLALRGRAERALARPVTHAVIAAAAPLDGAILDSLTAAADGVLTLTRVLSREAAAALAPGVVPETAAAHGAAIAAEDDTFAAGSRGLPS